MPLSKVAARNRRSRGWRCFRVLLQGTGWLAGSNSGPGGRQLGKGRGGVGGGGKQRRGSCIYI